MIGACCWLLVACGGVPPPPTATPEPAPPPTPAAALPTQLPPPTPLPSDAPVPPTETSLPRRPTPTPPPPTATPGLLPEAYSTLGNPDAPITIYEFSDFGCPSCRQYNLFTFQTIKERYIDTGQVYYVYKNYPIVSRNGDIAAQAAECAGEQGGYWEMHRHLFRDPAEWNGSRDNALQVFGDYGTALGLDGAALAQCVREERYKPDIDSDFNEGLDIGIFGTPTFIINRKLLSGAQPAEVFIEVIDRELNEDDEE